MTIQIGSYKTRPCQPMQSDPSITRTIIWQRKSQNTWQNQIRPTPSSPLKMQFSYGPVYGSGHDCQLTPQPNKYALNHQFNTFEEAVRFCKNRLNICGIVVELTLPGPEGNEPKLYEAGSTTNAVCHCPRQNSQPFKKVQAIWEKDKKKGWILTPFTHFLVTSIK